MKNLLSLPFFFSLLLCACDDDENTVPIVEEDPNWMLLEIPEGRKAYAIAGDIHSRLLVTTWTKAYYSDDAGATWTESYNFNGPVYGLLQRNDTVFSLILNNGSLAGVCHYYTVDYGRTWERDKDGSFVNLTTPIRLVESSKGVTYQVKENLAPTHEGAASSYINPSDVVKIVGQSSVNITLPTRKLRVMNIYLDDDNYLYLAASSGTFNENNAYVCCEPGSPALIYRSKQPFP